MVHLLELAVTFIERLENHLEIIRNFPHVEANLKKMVSINSIYVPHKLLSYYNWLFNSFVLESQMCNLV